MVKFIVSEKDNAAKRIAAILSKGKAKEEKSYSIPLYRFKMGKTEAVSMGLKGHILKVDFPEEYSNWQKIKPIELIDAEIVKVPTQKMIIKALKKEAKEAGEVIIATDFDREGELIGLDAVSEIKEVNENVSIRRARFSALTPPEIERAFSNLEELNIDLAKAAEARQDIDLIWGATLTRFISLASMRLGRQFLSVGRVQSPTLALIVANEKERRAFVPEPYWQIKALMADGAGDSFSVLHKKDRFLAEDEAKDVIDNLGKKGVVVSTKKTQKELAPPTPFNTTAFLTAASLIGLSPSYAMRIAEGLYMDGLVSYPRVDNTVYPASLEIKAILETLAEGDEFKALATELLAQKELKPTRGKKETTDHPPIHPTGLAKEESLRPEDWKVYELVVRRFMATLAGDATTESSRLDIDIERKDDKGAEPFFIQGSRVVKDGWLKFYSYGRKGDEDVPGLSEGDALKVKKTLLESKETQPPGRYGQGRLISEMEKLGLGTKSTRHAIIQNLYDRGYIHSDPIIPTEMGIAVSETLTKNAAAVSSPDLTADLENSMDKIADGKAEKESVVASSRNILRDITKTLEERESQVGEEIRNGIREGKIVGICAKCGGELRVIRSKRTKKRFVGCASYPDCKTAFPLPQFGDIIPEGETCKECGAPKVKVVTGKKRPWILCLDPACPTKKTVKEEE